MRRWRAEGPRARSGARRGPTLRRRTPPAEGPRLPPEEAARPEARGRARRAREFARTQVWGNSSRGADASALCWGSSMSEQVRESAPVDDGYVQFVAAGTSA